MKDEDKSKKQLIEELASLRQQVAELKTLEAERKRTGRALQESEQRYQLLVENIPTVAWVTNQDGRTIFISANVEKVYGYSADEILDAGEELWFGRIHPKDKDRVQDAFELLFSKQRPFDAEYRIQRKDGQWIWLQDRANIVEEKDGYLYAYGVFSDITGRKQAEEQLTILSSVVEQSGNSIVIIDPEGKVEYANPTFLELNEFSPDEVIGKNWRSFLSSSSTLREKFPEIQDTVLKRKMMWRGEVTDRTKSGEVIWRESTIFPIKNEQGEIIHSVYASVDITDRKRAEEALRESEATKQALLNAIPDMMFVIGGDGTFLNFIPSEKDEPLIPPNVFLGKKVWEVMPPEVVKGLMQGIERVLQTGEMQVVEYPLEMSGEGRYYEARIVVSGQDSILALVRDITERKQAENELKERLRFEELLSELSARFINLEVNQINIEIERAFENIGADFGIDRIVLWELSRDKQQYHISHSWSATGVDSIRVTLSADSFPYIKKKLLQGEPFMFSSVEELPEEAIAEKRYYDQQGIKSSLVIPLTAAGDAIGGLSLSTIHVNRNWSAGVVQRLLLLGEILSNALIRKRTDEALRESEGRLSSFMNSASDSFYLLDADLNFVEINQKGLEITGKSREEIIGKNITDIVPDVKESGRYEKHLEVIRTGQPFEIEDFVPHPVFGNLRFILKSFKVGEGLGVIASDITKRKQAEEALRKYTERLRILHEIDQGILTARSPAAIAQAALSRFRQLVPCQGAAVTLFDFTAHEAIILAVAVDTKTEVRAGSHVPLEQLEEAIKSLRQGQVITFGDLQSRGKMFQTVYAEGIRSFTVVPLISQGELIGSLNLSYEAAEPGVFTQEHEAIARQVADQLAIAIQQARLHEQIRRHAEELEQRVADRTRELSALYEVTAIASQPLDFKTMLAQSLERVLAAMKSHAGAIHLLDEGDETRHLAVQQGLPPDSLSQLESLPTHQGPGGWVIEHGKPLIVPDITTDPRMIVTSPHVIPRTYVGVPMRASGQVLGVLNILRETTQPQFSEEELTLLTSLADQVGAVVESHRLRQVAEQAAIMEERQRLARDLHDSVTQSLYSLTLLTETGRRAAVAGDLESVTGYLERLGEVAQQSLKEMRLLVYELRPLALEREGLVGALQQRLDTVEGRAGVETRLLVEGEVELAAPVEEALYRIAMEALNNALKHAAATSVTARIQADDDGIKLEIIDNGQGFDPQAISDRGGMGLVTMRERTEQLGGTLTVLSRLGKGTTIKVNMEVSQ